MSIQLHTVDNGNVQAINDGRLYSELTGGVGGIVNGSVVTSAGGLDLHITSGWGIADGRLFTITAEDIAVQPASADTQKGRLLIHIDLSQPDNPIDIRSVAAATLPALVQENLNEGGTVYEIELAHYDVTALAVSNLAVNEKVKFAGHAGTVDNAEKLGGQSPDYYATAGAVSTAQSTANTAKNTANAAMPKSGGTFTGNVAAYSGNRSGANLRNNEVVNSGWGAVSTNKLIFVRK